MDSSARAAKPRARRLLDGLMGLLLGLAVFWLAGPLMFADGPWRERILGLFFLGLAGAVAGAVTHRNERTTLVLVLMVAPAAAFAAVLVAHGAWLLPGAVLAVLVAGQIGGWLISRPKPLLPQD